MFVLEKSYSWSVCKFKFSWKQVFELRQCCWIKGTPNSATSICYYTFTTRTLMLSDNSSLHFQLARNCMSFSEKVKVGFTWQPVSRIWRKLKTKDMLQVVKSFILSKMSSTISLWRHSQAATPSKYSSLPEGFVVILQCCVGLVLWREKIWIFHGIWPLQNTPVMCRNFPPCEELNMWLNSAVL